MGEGHVRGNKAPRQNKPELTVGIQSKRACNKDNNFKYVANVILQQAKKYEPI